MDHHDDPLSEVAAAAAATATTTPKQQQQQQQHQRRRRRPRRTIKNHHRLVVAWLVSLLAWNVVFRGKKTLLLFRESVLRGTLTTTTTTTSCFSVDNNILQTAAASSSSPHDEQRDFSYTQEPPEHKYRNRRILIVFAGRRTRLQPQILYLERLIHTNELDYVHYYHCSPSAKDSLWLHEVDGILNRPFRCSNNNHNTTNNTKNNTGWFELRKLNPECGENRFNSVYHDYEKQPDAYINATFIKVDDDIVMFPLHGTLTRLIQYAGEHPEARWTSATCMNNPLVDYYLQRDGRFLPSPTAMPHMDFSILPQQKIAGKVIYGVHPPTSYAQRPKSLQELHSYVLDHTPELYQQIQSWKLGEDQEGGREDATPAAYIVPPGYRTALNFMVNTPAQQKRWELSPMRGFDELLIKHASWRTNTSVHIYKGAPAVHLSYGAQKQAGIVNPKFEGLYLDHACKTLHISSKNSILAGPPLNLCTTSVEQPMAEEPMAVEKPMDIPPGFCADCLYLKEAPGQNGEKPNKTCGQRAESIWTNSSKSSENGQLDPALHLPSFRAAAALSPSCCQGTNVNITDICPSTMEFCPDCPYGRFTCDERVRYFVARYGHTELSAQEALMVFESDKCGRRKKQTTQLTTS